MNADPTNPNPTTPDAPTSDAPAAADPPAPSTSDSSSTTVADVQQSADAAPADRVAAAAPAEDPRDDMIRQLAQRIEQLETERTTQPGASVGFGSTPAAAALNTPKPPDNLPNYAADWPQKGGLDAPQPWDLRQLGLTTGTADDGTVTVSSPHTGDVVQLAPGGVDTISPIVPAHGRPVLTGGSVGPDVIELGVLLGLLGYDNSVSRGENPQGVYDDSIDAAVEGFRRDYDVQEDPSQFARDRANNARSHVAAWTWEAVLRAASRVQDELQADGRTQTFARP